MVAVLLFIVGSVCVMRVQDGDTPLGALGVETNGDGYSIAFNGTPMPTRDYLNFVGTAVDCDDAIFVTTCTIETSATPTPQPIAPQQFTVLTTPTPRYGIPGWGWLAAGNQACQVDRITYIPIYVGATTTYIGVGANVTTGVAGGMRVGIYSDNGMQPATLVKDFGALDITSTAVVTIANPVTLNQGWYWLTYVCSSNATLARASLTDAVWAPITSHSLVGMGATTSVVLTQETGGQGATIVSGGFATTAVQPNDQTTASHATVIRLGWN